MSKILKEFNNKYPDIFINIINKKSSEMIDMLIDREIDLVIDTDMKIDDNHFLEKVKIIDLDSCFVSNYDFFKKIGEDLITIDDLIKYPIILPSKTTFNRKYLNVLLEKNNSIIKPLIEVNSSSISKSLIIEGLGIGWMIKEFIEQDLKEKKLYLINVNFDNIKVKVEVAYQNKYASEATKYFLEILKSNRF